MTWAGFAPGVVVHSAGTPLATTGSTLTSEGRTYCVPRASRRLRLSARLDGRGCAASWAQMASISGSAMTILLWGNRARVDLWTAARGRGCRIRQAQQSRACEEVLVTCSG